MTESYDPDEDRRSPGLEATKPDYKPHKDPTPPFLIKETKEPEGEFKYSPGEGTPDCSHPNRPDIANYERSDPLRPEHFRDILCDDLLERPIVKPEKPKLESPVVEPAKPREPQSETDASEAAKRALALLELPKPIDEPLEPPEIPVKSHIPSPERRPGVKTDILSPKISQPPPPALPSISEKKPFSPPLSQYTISVHPSPDVLPPFHSPDNTTTLPPIQTALRGLAHVNEPAVRVNGSSPYSLPPVTASSPPGLRSDPVWEHQRPSPFVPPPQIPPSPYSHLSPASTKDLNPTYLILHPPMTSHIVKQKARPRVTQHPQTKLQGARVNGHHTIQVRNTMRLSPQSLQMSASGVYRSAFPNSIPIKLPRECHSQTVPFLSH
ncbi:hypothetical protein AFLA_003590 [Aspergillus flavus NRRL3357]|nr:hypothetical protein AFLA_003590 [Aspergillus flavus NRRL3357]